MDFEKQLNAYIEQLNCSSKELADKSGISTAMISRFRNGIKTPNLKTSQLDKLSEGLACIASEKNINFTKTVIYSTFLKTLGDVIDIEQLRKKFIELITILNINTKDLAYSMGFSPSLISKIKSGQRNPAEPNIFIDGICRYIVTNFKSNEEKKAIAMLLECSLEDLSNEMTYSKKLSKWLASNSVPVTNSVDNFLNHLDDFNLDDYIKAIHFDEMKIPFFPFYRPISKKYFGIQEMKQGELEFFKATVLTKSMKPVFMCSDMPMEDMAEDNEFAKKWMLAIAMTLKKGLHLNVIHNLNRPFNEMMLGLESWIPLYMTGQVSPYYLKNFQDNTYCHFTYVSGNVALSGECIKGFHNKGKYKLITNKTELDYYKTKAECLLSIAEPLMETYKIENKNSFNAFMSSDANIKGKRRRILPSLPIHTISEKLLWKILKRNKVSHNHIDKILQFVKQDKEIIKTILKENIFMDEIEELSEEEFNKYKPSLFIANSFYPNKINYNYNEYIEHLKLTKEYQKDIENYELKINKRHAFRNIQIFIHDKKFVMISKNTSPTIHFVIYHPKLRSAIENFIPPVLE